MLKNLDPGGGGLPNERKKEADALDTKSSKKGTRSKSLVSLLKGCRPLICLVFLSLQACCNQSSHHWEKKGIAPSPFGQCRSMVVIGDQPVKSSELFLGWCRLAACKVPWVSRPLRPFHSTKERPLILSPAGCRRASPSSDAIHVVCRTKEKEDSGRQSPSTSTAKISPGDTRNLVSILLELNLCSL